MEYFIDDFLLYIPDISIVCRINVKEDPKKGLSMPRKLPIKKWYFHNKVIPRIRSPDMR